MSIWEQIVAALTEEISDLNDAGAAVRVTVRLLFAGFVGAFLGYERESQGKAAGVRTHILVSLGAALYVIVPLESGADSQAVSRVIQGLVAGIGFLGAGAIVKGRPHEAVRGLTTAAGIWVTAAIGMTIAMGRGLTALIAALIALGVLRFIPNVTPPPPPRNPNDPPSMVPPRTESQY